MKQDVQDLRGVPLTALFRGESALKKIQIALFALFLTGPLVTLSIFGLPDLYERRDFTSFPELGHVLSNNNVGRKQLSDALVERFYPRKWAVSARNWIDWRIFGFLDTDTVVSGGNGYLFYKPGIVSRACSKKDDITASLEAYRLHMALAAAAGMDLMITMSPNKETIEKDSVTGRAAIYAKCYDEIRQIETDAYQRYGRGMFHSHEDSIRRIGSRVGQRYARYDTHWVPAMHIAAIEDIRKWLGYPARLTTINTTTQTRNLELTGMVAQNDPETIPDAVNDDLAKWAAQLQKIPGRTVILHDSFYMALANRLSPHFQDVKFIHLEDAAAAFRNRPNAQYDEIVASLKRADRIIVNSVERFMAMRYVNSALSWDSVLGQEILRRNSTVAKARCGSDSAADAPESSLTLKNLERVSLTRFHVTAGDPYILIEPGAAPAGTRTFCFSLAIKAPGSEIVGLAIPGHGAAFSKYSVVTVPLDHQGRGEVNLLLPADYMGSVFRITPTFSSQDFEIDRLKTGWQ
ncbi:hypothetical protein C8D77_102517 [Mesorhizobium loti]|uniref:AlgX/AlgJ SGNH hydrolase-like domain-containing protein n=1 Tax=Rhizobium loti TaxID=381 RepID=A0A8E2WEP2_RHILI|nr:hypothetical protein [Mesorhizobium loti]AXX39114.1 OatB [Mesorhizobium loti]PWJ92742.1 hypothetical protein C8D77_102517 [Mesorhizobium loti]